MSPRDIQDIRYDERQLVLEQQRMFNQAIDPVWNQVREKFDRAMWDFQDSHSRCLDLLLWRDSPTWHKKVEHHRDRFDKAFNDLGDTLRYLTDFFPRETERAVGQPIALPDTSPIILIAEALHSEMKEALSRALTSDELDKLRTVHEKRSRDSRWDALRQYSQNVDISKPNNTRLFDYTVYLGTEGLRLQHEEGLNTFEQWQAMWNDLNPRSHTLHGLEKAGWEQLRKLGAGRELMGAEKRALDQQIDKYKRRMRPYTKWRQSGDSES